MKPPPPLADEERRLCRLEALGLLDTEPEALLDDFTELAATATGMPIALISLIDRNRQWMKSAVGLPQGFETPRRISFCGHAIACDDPVFEVEDTLQDARFFDNPLVRGAPGVRHYAGVPLEMPGGERIGTLCVLGDQPGQLDQGARRLLVRLARGVERTLLQRESAQELGARLRAESAMRESEASFRALTEAIPQMVWASTPEGQVSYQNQRWREFVGAATGLDGQAWSEAIHPEDRDRVQSAWQASLYTGQPYEGEFRLRHQDGAYRWVLSRALPVHDDAGRVLRWLGTLTDIEDQKRALNELEDSSQRKDAFLAMLAHELRNPLAPIGTAAQILRAAPRDPERVVRAGELIGRQVGHMSALVDDLLDVSRVTRGLVRIARLPVDLREVLRAALEQARPHVEARRHALVVEIDETRCAQVLGDQVRLVQIVVNLLNNAAKYTNEGGRIVLSLRIDEGGTAAILVQDSGSGIDSELLPHLFDLFTQAQRTPDRAQGGLGLGLALARTLARLHGGDVTVKSAGSGAGSTFTVTLPLDVAHAHASATPAPAPVPAAPVPAAASATPRGQPPHPGSPSPSPSPSPSHSPSPLPPSPAPSPTAAAGTGSASPSQRPGAASHADAPGRSLRVMVVDDNTDAADMLGVWLETLGHTAVVRTDSQQALDAALADPAQVYVLDIGLPGMDGYELARRLRSSPRTRGATLVALTGYGQAEDMLRSREAGFDFHFVKPMNPDRLSELLQQLPAGRDEATAPPH
ncbi:ATP-binding protein [Ramlibacter sp. AN1015]|uniref:ATP-binding protein n=1 Tax=Ramlibacter sp. AN1015 TaxID=3133428 RepID=UPI0030BA5DE9